MALFQPIDRPAAAPEPRDTPAQRGLHNLRTAAAALEPSQRARTLRLVLDALIVPAAPKGGAR
ncbi:hypothetical protein ACIQWB_37685 [Streptomyces olivaceus]|uniref:hypothetical protein n=1 Tax=Streptomyces olivaceus TaxID=47716 RepID=UPI0037FCBC83